MPNVNQDGTFASVVGSEITIVDVTANKHYDFYIDCSALASGESLELRMKMKVLTGSSLKVKEFGVITYPTTDQEVWRIPWESQPWEYQITGKQVGGTTRNFPWSLVDA